MPGAWLLPFDGTHLTAAELPVLQEDFISGWYVCSRHRKR